MEVLMDNYIGIDVAKATLQIYIPKNDLDVEITNSESGLKTLYSKLKKQYKKDIDNIVFVYESTGSYSTYLEQFSESKHIKCFKVGAYQSSSFSKVVKNRSKTDIVDARMLSNMHTIANDEDIKIPSRDVKAHQIRSYIKYYQSLVKEEIRSKNYLEAATFNLEDKFVLKQVERKIKNIQKEQVAIISKTMKIINSNEKYKKAYENITSIKGIGEKSGIVLLYLFLRYPKASRQHITALCGLDPIQRTSGTSVQHKERISKQGLSLVRAILFMPTMAAIQHNQEMKLIYDRLVDKGKPKPLAQIAVMRKIILLAHALYKNNERYDKNRYLNFTQTKIDKDMK
jgi:transposase